VNVPPHAARPTIPVFLVGHRPDAAGLIVSRPFAVGETTIVERRLLPITLFRDVRRHFRYRHDANTSAALDDVRT